MVKVRKETIRSNTEAAKSKSAARNKKYLEYQRYIRSKYWRETIKPAVLERDEYRCQCCGRTAEEANLSVHHSTYDILYREMEEDNLKYLITLCQYCHYAIHHCKSNYKRFKMTDNETHNDKEDI